MDITNEFKAWLGPGWYGMKQKSSPEKGYYIEWIFLSTNESERPESFARRVGVGDIKFFKDKEF